MKKIYILALILAIATGIAAYSLVQYLEDQAKPAEIPMATVVVTTTEIGEGVFITGDMVQLKPIPQEYVASGAVTSLGDAVGKVNKFRSMAGQQVLYDQLGSTESADIVAGGRLSYTLREGMRAMTIYTTETTGVAGYINAGDRVDIICTVNVQSEDEEGNIVSTPTSMMLLENVNVLETGIITAKLAEAEEGTTSLYTSITLEVKPADAVKVQYAVNYGQISFLLRAVDDEKIIAPEDYTGFVDRGGYNGAA